MKNKNVASRREARITFPTCPSREENDLDLVKISTFVWENEKMLEEGENYNRNRFTLYDASVKFRRLKRTMYNIVTKGDQISKISVLNLKLRLR